MEILYSMLFGVLVLGLFSFGVVYVLDKNKNRGMKEN